MSIDVRDVDRYVGADVVRYRFDESIVVSGEEFMDCLFFFFFFQAEDGIRDHCVTGVQTCALPIWA